MGKLLKKLNNHGIMANDGEHGKEIVKFFESIGAKINCTGNMYHNYHTLKDGYLECIPFEKPQHIITLEEVKNLKIMGDKKQTAVEWIIKEIDEQQKSYIDLAKKNKSLAKGVDAILTATTLLKMKCKQAKEMESNKNKKFDEMLEMLKEIVEDFEEADLLVVKISTIDKAKQLIKESTKI
jgi:hypothetical protein